MENVYTSDGVPGRYWHALADGRIQCDLCPRECKLHEGQRGLCFVRGRTGDQIVLTTYGRSSGFCLDPIEKKPLNHFLPGTAVLSFGTAGCNLTCKFCQNWDISKARDLDRLQQQASPQAIAHAACATGARSVAFTYNDPVIFLEYAVDVAAACREVGLQTVAVTAGYITKQARGDFYEHIDAANVDLKGFTEGFYRNLCGGRLAESAGKFGWMWLTPVAHERASYSGPVVFIGILAVVAVTWLLLHLRATRVVCRISAVTQRDASRHRRATGSAEARLQRRLQQELQGALQIHPQRRPLQGVERRGRG
jgi:hypothetical protein